MAVGYYRPRAGVALGILLLAVKVMNYWENHAPPPPAIRPALDHAHLSYEAAALERLQNGRGTRADIEWFTRQTAMNPHPLPSIGDLFDGSNAIIDSIEASIDQGIKLIDPSNVEAACAASLAIDDYEEKEPDVVADSSPQSLPLSEHICMISAEKIPQKYWIEIREKNYDVRQLIKALLVQEKLEDVYTKTPFEKKEIEKICNALQITVIEFENLWKITTQETETEHRKLEKKAASLMMADQRYKTLCHYQHHHKTPILMQKLTDLYAGPTFRGTLADKRRYEFGRMLRLNGNKDLIHDFKEIMRIPTISQIQRI